MPHIQVQYWENAALRSKPNAYANNTHEKAHASY